jgi:hypothetical protein
MAMAVSATLFVYDGCLLVNIVFIAGVPGSVPRSLSP